MAMTRRLWFSLISSKNYREGDFPAGLNVQGLVSYTESGVPCLPAGYSEVHMYKLDCDCVPMLTRNQL
jgi:hypothetical protein